MNLLKRDKRFIWHPYTSAKTRLDPISIVKGKGAYLYDDKGKRYIDAVSSWWTNIHGHAHPYIAKRVSAQLKKLEHVIFAGFTHEPAVHLAEKLLSRLPSSQKKIFYSDNGSTAVEVALKMAIQYWKNKGEKRNKIIAFKNAYHGDTFGAMSVSGRTQFTLPFIPYLFEVEFIDAPIPGNEGNSLSQLQAKIRSKHKNIAAFIFEPLVQGTAGMIIHQPEGLEALIQCCRKNNIIAIADEVMTGFGRTGKFFATDFIRGKPDIYCLSKGLTGGTMALGVTSCTEKIYRAFVSNDSSKTFFHGHSYTANPVACSAAIASLELFDRAETNRSIKRIEKRHAAFAKVVKQHRNVSAVRHRGTILAIELKTNNKTSYFNKIRDKAYDFFIKRGIILRPLGNILYILPPYCISDKDLTYIYRSVIRFLDSNFKE